MLDHNNNLPPQLANAPKEENFFLEIIKFAFVALIIVMPIRLFVAQPFVVSGASMAPTFESNEYLIVDQLTYHVDDPHRGDVIIFRFPLEPSTFFIKRVIGLPEETVQITGSTVTIFNEEHPDGFVLAEPYINPENEKSDVLKITLKDNEYFVMGDNRKASSDSRMWGTLPRDFIVGRALIRLFPVTHASILPGKAN